MTDEREQGSAAPVPDQLAAARVTLRSPLARFNLAAFLVPPVWGPFHGLWAGAIFLPMWVFAASSVEAAAGEALAPRIAAVVVAACTVAAQVWFARHANDLAYARVHSRVSVERFKRQQRIWAGASLPLAAALLWLIIG